MTATNSAQLFEFHWFSNLIMFYVLIVTGVLQISFPQ